MWLNNASCKYRALPSILGRFSDVELISVDKIALTACKKEKVSVSDDVSDDDNHVIITSRGDNVSHCKKMRCFAAAGCHYRPMLHGLYSSRAYMLFTCERPIN